MNPGLPSYLQFSTDGHALAESIIEWGDVRITAITPKLLRIEQGTWTDAATLRVLHRAFCPVHLRVKREESVLTVDTGALVLRLEAGRPLEKGLCVQGERFVWHFGQKPMYNLKGTVSTLDQVNGVCDLEDGLCARDGFTFFEDGDTPVFTEEGWFAPREKETDVYFFGYGHDYLACVQDFQRLTGTHELLPAFALGNWWSRYHAYTQQEYLDLMDAFDKHDVPLSVGIVDMDWHLTSGEGRTYHEGWTGYTWNEALFPDHRAFLNELHARGLKTAFNLHPAQGVRPYEKVYAQMAEAMGQTDGKTVAFNCLDPRFLKAYFEVLHFPMEREGVDFWWMDWQQGTDYEAFAGDALDEESRKLTDITPLWMLNHMHMLAARRNGGRGMIFSRYSGYGSGRNPIGFSGDTYSTWESLRFQPYFTATASNAGYGWWSHDIGGHMGGVRDDELTARWVQLGVFSPIFRLHSTHSTFNTREPWGYNRRAEEVIERFMRLRHQLFPYLYTMNQRSRAQQLPLIAPMYHLHPEAEEAYQVPNEYWFGSELIAAPITERADVSDLAAVDVWLPEGVWTDAHSGLVYRGGQRLTVCRPLEEMPLFLKAGALVPMQTGWKRLGGAEELTLWVAPGASGAFTLYEDDGETLAEREGHFCETQLTWDWQETRAVLNIAPPAGDTSLIPARRLWQVRLRGFRAGMQALLDGKPVEGVYDAETATYTVTVENSGTLTVTHPDGLTFDNGDVRRRAIDRLLHAQLSLREKEALLTIFDQALDPECRRWRFPVDVQRTMSLALMELVNCAKGSR